MQLRDFKYCLKEGKFRNGILPSSCKDNYHLQDGQVKVMLSRSALHFRHLLFSQQHRKVHKAEVKDTPCAAVSALRVGKLEPVFINSYSLLAAIIN